MKAVFTIHSLGADINPKELGKVFSLSHYVTLCHTMSHYVTLPANTYISVKDCERKFSADIAFIHHFQIFQDSMGECSPKAVQGGAGATHFFTS